MCVCVNVCASGVVVRGGGALQPQVYVSQTAVMLAVERIELLRYKSLSFNPITGKEWSGLRGPA